MKMSFQVLTVVLYIVIKETDRDNVSKSGYDTSEQPFVKVKQFVLS